ncbi:MAG: AAA family ATPase, partial [Lachnospiraceae bacterium]|nr:AAA family ATPase [Lachnospiraceae bacterium]
SDRMDIVSPGSWLLPKSYDQYPMGSIPSIRRNSIIAACLDMANLMERGGTGFQTMIESYSNSADHLQPVVLIYPGFLDLRLFDRFYEDEYIVREELSVTERVLELLRTEGPKRMKELQEVTNYKSRSQFLTEVIKPLMEEGRIYRDGNVKSPKALIKLNN